MANHIKYTISIQHVNDAEKLDKVESSRVIKVCDTIEQAKSELKNLLEMEPETVKQEIRDFMDCINDTERRFLDDDYTTFPYRAAFHVLHDREKLYFGPGAYVLDKTVLS